MTDSEEKLNLIFSFTSDTCLNRRHNKICWKREQEGRLEPGECLCIYCRINKAFYEPTPQPTKE